MIHDTLGSYRIVGKIGEGGMGAVYLAEHTLIGKKVAVKVLLPDLSRNQEIVQRFFNEARASTLLKHPGVVDVFDFGYHTSGSAYLVMEFLEGESLAARIRHAGRLEPAVTIEIGRQVAGALALAHQRGIVHRDLKPDNVFLVGDRDLPFGIRTKLLDFGIAKLAGESSSSSVKTRTGAMMGTPMYMSPEQCRGAGAVDHRTDIYSLGCMLFEMVMGQPPFMGEGPGDVIAMHLFQDAPSLDGLVPAPLAAIVHRAITKKPDGRYATMAEMGTQLEAAGTFRPSGAMPAASPTMVNRPTFFAGGPTTTLSRSAGQVDSVPPEAGARARRITIAAVSAALLIAGGGYWFFGHRTAASLTATSGTPAAAPLESTVAAQSPPAPAAASKVHFTIESTPVGVDVFRLADGLRLGRTPFATDAPHADGEAVFVLKLAGYEDAQITLPASRGGLARATLLPLATKPAHEPHHSRPKTPSPATGAPKPAAKPVANGVVDPF